jgi:hypothetical protein
VCLVLFAAISAIAAAEPRERAARGDIATGPFATEVLTPLLRDWILESRNAAVEKGVHVIPAAIRSALAGYVPDDILDKVRWQVGGAGSLSLQEHLFRFGYAPAVTLDYVVVFQDSSGLDDPKLWVHELRHVMQFAEWGIAEFASRYLRDYEAVERDAAEYRWEWMKLAGLTPRDEDTDSTTAD